MNVDFTVTALMFPAIPLIMAVYSRSHTLSALVRKLHDEQIFQKQIPSEWKKQLENFDKKHAIFNTIYIIYQRKLMYIYIYIYIY